MHGRRHAVLKVQSLLSSWKDCPPEEEGLFASALLEIVAAAAPDLCAGLNRLSAGRLDELATHAAPTQALLEALSSESSYMLSRGKDGNHMATVVLAGTNVESTATAATASLALGGAIVLALVELHGAQLGLPVAIALPPVCV